MVKGKAKGINKRLICSSRKNLKEGKKKKKEKKRGKTICKELQPLYFYLIGSKPESKFNFATIKNTNSY